MTSQKKEEAMVRAEYDNYVLKVKDGDAIELATDSMIQPIQADLCTPTLVNLLLSGARLHVA